MYTTIQKFGVSTFLSSNKTNTFIQLGCYMDKKG